VPRSLCPLFLLILCALDRSLAKRPPPSGSRRKSNEPPGGVEISASRKLPPRFRRSGAASRRPLRCGAAASRPPLRRRRRRTSARAIISGRGREGRKVVLGNLPASEVHVAVRAHRSLSRERSAHGWGGGWAGTHARAPSVFHRAPMGPGAEDGPLGGRRFRTAPAGVGTGQHKADRERRATATLALDRSRAKRLSSTSVHEATRPERPVERVCPGLSMGRQA